MTDDDEIERAAVNELIQEAKKAEENIKPLPKPGCINKRLLCSSLASTLRNPILPKPVHKRKYVGLDDIHFDEDEEEKKKRPDDGPTYDPGADYIYDARKYFDPEKYREIVANRRKKEEMLKEQEELLKTNVHFYQPRSSRSRSVSTVKYYIPKQTKVCCDRDLVVDADRLDIVPRLSHSLSPANNVLSDSDAKRHRSHSRRRSSSRQDGTESSKSTHKHSKRKREKLYKNEGCSDDRHAKKSKKKKKKSKSEDKNVEYQFHRSHSYPVIRTNGESLDCSFSNLKRFDKDSNSLCSDHDVWERNYAEANRADKFFCSDSETSDDENWSETERGQSVYDSRYSPGSQNDVGDNAASENADLMTADANSDFRGCELESKECLMKPCSLLQTNDAELNLIYLDPL